MTDEHGGYVFNAKKKKLKKNLTHAHVTYAAFGSEWVEFSEALDLLQVCSS